MIPVTAVPRTLRARRRALANAPARPVRARRAAAATVAALGACMALAASAYAAVPSVSTGGTRDVSYNTATLDGLRQPERERHLVLLPVRADEGLRRPDRDR